MIQFFVRRFRAKPDGSPDEAGLAMIMAVIIVMLMTLIPLAVYAGAVAQLPLARHDQDHDAALAAAEAGVDDYLTRLAQNSNYWNYSATNPPTPANAAFTGWVQVPGGSVNAECFRYTPDTSQTASSGIIYLKSSGKRLTNPTGGCDTSGVIRTVQVGLRRQGFLDYLWLTDYEITDPTLSGANATACAVHAWEYNTAKGGYGPYSTSQCGVVYWSKGSVLNGPVHSNDGLYVCQNPTFNGPVDTYYNSPVANSVAGSTKFAGPGAILPNPNTCSPAPVWSRTSPPDPASGSILPFPPANTEIKEQADATLGGKGCLYTGPTTITLLATGKMNVTSSKTKSTNAGCGPGNNLSLPTNGVIYVQNVPASTSDPNHSSCSGSSCFGDVTISGTLNGQLTVASENDILIPANLKYHQYPSGSDVLGLVADNDVAVVHGSGATVYNDLEIDAAIMSLKHSFYVQNWGSGSNAACSGTYPCVSPAGHSLIINGVITQEFRGPVGTFDTSTGKIISGYNKAYAYDTRLKFMSPPYFLSPTQSAWIRLSYAELQPTATP